ncbi:unnamed protein product [Fraxinus pennsylvanica]|uniref:V-type proton ATPase subunit a n=1 Tax=Fraxinus pennsylvanica TaxID=56036 RepID=A0AAD1YSF6_9LAMI|nr:unnamed protein product [Fraxinus pennsylvanica]
MADEGCWPAMDLLRSEPMQLVQLIIPFESAYRTISYLGDLGLFQFNDLNAEKSLFQRTYAAQIKGCGEMACKLRFFRDQMIKEGLSPSSTSSAGPYVDLDELEKASQFFHSAQSSAAAQHKESEAHILGEGSVDSPLLLEQEMSTEPLNQMKLGFVSGLVGREKSVAFERILFRATRGNIFLRQLQVVMEDPVIDPVSGDKVEKNVFFVFYSGERADSKILKICDAFGANRYPFTDDLGKQYLMITEVLGKLSELKATIDVGQLHQANLLQTIGYEFEQWNLLTKESPPTYFRTNKFTSAIQEIVDAYGVAKYQEANPGVFTIITFPFLFAVMFGDWGHGICLFLATLYFISREKKLSRQKLGDIMEMTFGGRYVIMMMALFSIYTGLIWKLRLWLQRFNLQGCFYSGIN